jgi:membrane protease YdiL (CAAX protease family)
MPWLALIALIGSQLLVLFGIAIWLWSYPRGGIWIATPLGAFTISAISGIAALSVPAIFSRAATVSSIVGLFELRALRQGLNISAPVVGVLLGGIGILVVRCHLAGDVGNASMARYFVPQLGVAKYLFATLLLIGPIVEEIVMRGFLYRAFRRGYHVIFSISAIVLVAMVTHWNAIASSIWVLFLLAGLQVILCVLLERTHSLWNCIVCHIAYNATLLVADIAA